jgi:hypothetical protein
LLSASERSAAIWIRRAYQLTLGRNPGKQETVRAEAFLATYEDSYGTSGPAAPLLAKAEPARPADWVDQVDQTDAERNAQAGADEIVQAKNPKEAAWMSFVQALYASAEFRFVR